MVFLTMTRVEASFPCSFMPVTDLLDLLCVNSLCQHIAQESQNIMSLRIAQQVNTGEAAYMSSNQGKYYQGDSQEEGKGSLWC